MTQEEKQLLLKDLCARLPYGVKVYGNYSYSDGDKIVDDKRVEILDLSKLDWFFNGIEIKPYLRPMSSMTEEEKETYNSFFPKLPRDLLTPDMALRMFDWLIKNHFDYRGLIEKEMAYKATKDMYDIKQENNE